MCDIPDGVIEMAILGAKHIEVLFREPVSAAMFEGPDTGIPWLAINKRHFTK
jgi:hypothetical protein